MAKKSPQAKKPKQKKPVAPIDKPQGYSVYVDDNFSSFSAVSNDAADELPSQLSGRFATYEDALAEAQRIVQHSVRSCYKSDMTRADLLNQYKAFGADPFIVPRLEGRPQFSAWNYADDVADEIFSEIHPNRSGDLLTMRHTRETIMKFTFEELEQILDLSDEEKRQGIKVLYETGAFEQPGFATKEKAVIALRINDSLFEADPFYLCPFVDFGESYFDYLLVVNELMKDDRYKDIELTYQCLEDMHEYFGLASRSKIYEAMVAVQRVLKLPAPGLLVIDVD